ncbi:MAG: hypothetical protein KF859_06055 [Phycisphaeraceae bacterium]|nr:hypothetical protein [Phycisphaeraceae bacterium]
MSARQGRIEQREVLNPDALLAKHPRQCANDYSAAAVAYQMNRQLSEWWKACADYQRFDKPRCDCLGREYRLEPQVVRGICPIQRDHPLT